MKTLFNGEIRKINGKNWLKVLFICVVLVVAFLYFFAGVSSIKPEEVQNNSEIGTYLFVYRMGLLLGLCIFSIVSAMLNNRLIVEEYTTEKVYMLFSYPIKRNHLFLVKAGVAAITSMMMTCIGLIVAFSLFYLGESFISIIPDTFDRHLIPLLLSSSAVFFSAILSNTLILENLFLCILMAVIIASLGTIVATYCSQKMLTKEV